MPSAVVGLFWPSRTPIHPYRIPSHGMRPPPRHELEPGAPPSRNCIPCPDHRIAPDTQWDLVRPYTVQLRQLG